MLKELAAGLPKKLRLKKNTARKVTPWILRAARGVSKTLQQPQPLFSNAMLRKKTGIFA